MGTYIRSGAGRLDPESLFTKIWSAAALAEPQYHEEVIKAHIEYIRSGSEILSTNSYGVQPNYYKKAFGNDAYENLMVEHAKLSANLATIARERCPSQQNVKVFGVLGPICESHNPKLLKTYIKENGSSFCTDFYSKVSNALYDGGVDGFIIETMNSWEEACFALEGLKRTQQSRINTGNNENPLPIMVNFQGSLRNDEHQNDPDNLGKYIIKQFIDYVDLNPLMNIISFGLNCSSPEDMMKSFQCIFETKIYSNVSKDLSKYESVKDTLNRRNIGVSAYPNLHDISRYETQGYEVGNGCIVPKRIDMITNDHERFLSFMDDIVQNFNVNYIGGCCGCTPAGIQKLSEKYIK